MKVLVIGGGGREHAIVDALSRSPQVEKIYCAPGNAGIARQAECVAIRETEVERLRDFAAERGIGLTVVGPEVALAAGVVDCFRAAGLRIFGPTKAAARIESSKEFAKRLMAKYAIPTAGFRAFNDYAGALAYVQGRPLPAVLKYDGLAAGKGVVIARTMAEAEAALRDMLLDDKFGEGKVVVEDYLEGPEFSFMCFVSGHKVWPMALAQELQYLLISNQYDAQCVEEFTDVAGQILASQADMVLLDINLPEVDGQSVLRELRKTSDIPVIMVTSKNTEMDEVISMSFGADDFIAKPYNPSILLLHIEAVFKRLGKMDADKGLTYKNMTLDTARGVLTVGDNSVELTKNEAGILSYLLKHQNTIVTRDELISYLWDSEAFVDDNTLTVNMNRVRKKLADLGVEDIIRTKRGQGYILA